MQEEKYAFNRGPEISQYEFFSEGPKGSIQKIVQFQLIDEDRRVFNLAFGDWDEDKGTIDDSTKSNNGDRQKILATVAHTVLDFMNKQSKAIVLAQGSTASRTRLYQMGIGAFYDEIDKYFYIEGYIDGQWEHFRPKRNYEAFLLEHK